MDGGGGAFEIEAARRSSEKWLWPLVRRELKLPYINNTFCKKKTYFQYAQISFWYQNMGQN